MNYMAACGGDCESVDKSTLKWFKIAEAGYLSPDGNGGTWATNKLLDNNYTWPVKVPSTIAAGNYVLRHEILALHAAGQADGAQNYPQCINLQVTGGGTAKPDGVVGTELYKVGHGVYAVSTERRC